MIRVRLGHVFDVHREHRLHDKFWKKSGILQPKPNSSVFNMRTLKKRVHAARVLHSIG